MLKCRFKHCNDPKGFLEYSNDIDDIYENIDEYKLNKKCKILIIFDMIAGMFSNKKLQPIVTELFKRRSKINISHVFIIQLHFVVAKIFRLNHNHYFIIKISNKQRFQQIIFNNLSETDFKKLEAIFQKQYKK